MQKKPTSLEALVFETLFFEWHLIYIQRRPGYIIIQTKTLKIDGWFVPILFYSLKFETEISNGFPSLHIHYPLSNVITVHSNYSQQPNTSVA